MSVGNEKERGEKKTHVNQISAKVSGQLTMHGALKNFF